MADLFFKDSKNRYHRICIQMYNNSCGPAAVAMAERIYKHLDRSDETRARDISKKYPYGWSPSNSGTTSCNLSNVLNSIGVKTYAATNVSWSGVYSYLNFYVSFSTPVIAMLTWNGGGNHFAICAVRDPDGTFVFYDPWYGVVEVTSKNFPYYKTASGEKGYLNGWLVITRQ